MIGYTDECYHEHVRTKAQNLRDRIEHTTADLKAQIAERQTNEKRH
jgi:hypothetical protein